jgi:hypothetical protein
MSVSESQRKTMYSDFILPTLKGLGLMAGITLPFFLVIYILTLVPTIVLLTLAVMASVIFILIMCFYIGETL